MPTPDSPCASAATIPVFWKGVDRAGNARGGHAFIESAAKFVEERYEQGWRSLTVTSRGEEVGGIANDGWNNQPHLRRWWGSV